MSLQTVLCKIGIHNYRTVEATNCFSTTYADLKSTVNHFVWYQKCSCCGKRRLKDTVKKDNVFNERHNGIELSRVEWVEHGKMYIGKGQIISDIKPKATLHVINGDKK